VSTLLLTLSAPVQSWGASSRFTERQTRHEPTKSAVIGLLAAALGRRRADSVEDLLHLKFGVRIDQPGVLMRDFHTAHRTPPIPRHLAGWPRSRADHQGSSMPLSNRYYLCDAVFLAGLEAERPLLDGLADALLHPTFPLYLGRRSCVPSGRLLAGLVDQGLVEALRQFPWQALSWHRRGQPDQVALELIHDVLPDDGNGLPKETVRDLPQSFSPARREYGWRDVVHDTPVVVSNPDGRQATPAGPDWLEALGGL